MTLFGPSNSPFTDEFELGPPFIFNQELPHDTQTFAAASLAAEIVRRDPSNLLEIRHQYRGIPVNSAAIPEAFTTAIPDIDLTGFDISIPDQTKLGLYGIWIRLHNQRNPKHHIYIRAPQPDARNDAFNISDNFNNRRPRSAPFMSTYVVKDFLKRQLKSHMHDRTHLDSNIPQLGMYLGQYGLGDYTQTQTMQAKLSSANTINVELSNTYDRAALLSGKPVSQVESTWLSATLPDSVLGLGQATVARTIARYNLQNIFDRGNKLHYEVEAPELDVQAAEDLLNMTRIRRNDERQAMSRRFALTLGQFVREHGL